MRYKLVFSYNGRGLQGFQIQKDKLTVAKILNDALTKVLKCDISVTASGRTDSDVSAIAQVGHFDYDGAMPKNFVGYINSVLPDSVKIASCEEAPNFHARYDSKQKTYMYKFYISREKNAYFDTFAYHIKSCNIQKIEEAIKYLIGTHDFSAFCATGTAVKDKVRTITNASLSHEDNLYTFTITGNGFLYNMVRIIMGTLVDIGTKDLLSTHMHDVIESLDRSKAGPTLPAYPLVLVKVEY